MDTSGFKAIVEMAEMIKNPKALQEAAAILADGFKLSDEEIKKREEYNSIVQKAAAVQKETAELISKNEGLLAKIEAVQIEHDNHVKEAQIALEAQNYALRGEKESLDSKAESLKARETEILRLESELSVREKAVVAKENELRAREEVVEEREARMKKVVEAMG